MSAQNWIACKCRQGQSSWQFPVQERENAANVSYWVMHKVPLSRREPRTMSQNQAEGPPCCCAAVPCPAAPDRVLGLLTCSGASEGAAGGSRRCELLHDIHYPAQHGNMAAILRILEASKDRIPLTTPRPAGTDSEALGMQGCMRGCCKGDPTVVSCWVVHNISLSAAKRHQLQPLSVHRASELRHYPDMLSSCRQGT